MTVRRFGKAPPSLNFCKATLNRAFRPPCHRALWQLVNGRAFWPYGYILCIHCALPSRALRCRDHDIARLIFGSYSGPCRKSSTAPDHPMTEIVTKPRIKVLPKTQRPGLHKVILVNDDYTPREFVVTVLKAEFRMSGDQAYRVMMTAHRRGAFVVAGYTKDVAETKPPRPTEAGRPNAYPLLFTTDPAEYLLTTPHTPRP